MSSKQSGAPSTGSVAEWSKALDSSSSLFGGVGSNPTWTIFFGFPYFVQDKLSYADTNINVNVAEWLRRQTWNLVGFARAGSNPVVDARR